VTYDQADLFSPITPRARTTDPRSSHEAARQANIGAGCKNVLDVLAGIGRPSTTAEMERFLPRMQRNVIARRCRDLEERGLTVCDRDQVPARWSLTDEGRKAASR